MEPHERLEHAMDARRLQLRPRLNWKALADAANISYEALRSIRRGDYRPSAIAAAGLDDALQWSPGSVEAVLDGGEAVPLQLPSDFDTEAAQLQEDREQLVSVVERALERRIGRRLTGVQRRVTVEWADSLERTIKALDEETG